MAEGELSNPVTLNLYRLDGRDVVEVTDFVRRKFVRFDLDGGLLEEVVVSPGGEIWARRRTLSADSAGPVDVFHGSGDYLGTLPPSTPLPALFLPDDRIAVVESGELDVPYVVVYRTER